MNITPQPNTPRKGKWNQRIFAWANARKEDAYENATATRKRALFGNLHGTILEIGPGNGPNLRYLPSDVQWLGVEPNPYMLPYLQHTLDALALPAGRFRVDPGDPQGGRLPAEDGSIDAVVSTLVLCSVPNPADSLREILRVLKPGGRFMFIEHVAALRGSRLRKFQDFIQPLWSLLGDGCHPNRETWDMISQAGFARVELEHFLYSGGGPAAPHISGTAVKGN